MSLGLEVSFPLWASVSIEEGAEVLSFDSLTELGQILEPRAHRRVEA